MRHAGLWAGYQRLRLELGRLARLTYFLRDAAQTFSAMH
jgi:hypothetical protein